MLVKFCIELDGNVRGLPNCRNRFGIFVLSASPCIKCQNCKRKIEYFGAFYSILEELCFQLGKQSGERGQTRRRQSYIHKTDHRLRQKGHKVSTREEHQNILDTRNTISVKRSALSARCQQAMRQSLASGSFPSPAAPFDITPSQAHSRATLFSLTPFWPFSGPRPTFSAEIPKFFAASGPLWDISPNRANQGPRVGCLSARLLEHHNCQ